MIIFKENVLDTDTYLALRKVYVKVEEAFLMRKASKALCNSLYTQYVHMSLVVRSAYREGFVGDGAVICYIQDLIVVPDAQAGRN